MIATRASLVSRGVTLLLPCRLALHRRNSICHRSSCGHGHYFSWRAATSNRLYQQDSKAPHGSVHCSPALRSRVRWSTLDLPAARSANVQALAARARGRRLRASVPTSEARAGRPTSGSGAARRQRSSAARRGAARPSLADASRGGRLPFTSRRVVFAGPDGSEPARVRRHPICPRLTPRSGPGRRPDRAPFPRLVTAAAALGKPSDSYEGRGWQLASLLAGCRTARDAATAPTTPRRVTARPQPPPQHWRRLLLAGLRAPPSSRRAPRSHTN
eukprot:scaffold547_cov384-Prasinococcus_capsulatus_cf.AAC.11